MTNLKGSKRSHVAQLDLAAAGPHRTHKTKKPGDAWLFPLDLTDYSAVGTSAASLISGRSTSSTKAIGALSP